MMITLIVCVIPSFIREVIGVDQKTRGIKEDAKPFDNLILAGCFSVLKFILMIGLYVGAIVFQYSCPTSLHRRRDGSKIL